VITVVRISSPRPNAEEGLGVRGDISLLNQLLNPALDVVFSTLAKTSSGVLALSP